MNGISTRWRILAMLFMIACLNYADRTAISSVYPLLQSELGFTNVGLGAIGSFFLWSYAFGSPIAGRLSDRFSRSKLVVGSLVAWSVITIATGAVNSANQLLFTRVLLGLAECAYLPAAIALLADHHPSRTRATAMGIHLAGLNLGLVGGGALAGYLGDHYGWRAGLFSLGAAGLLLAAIAAFVLQDAGPRARAVDAVSSPRLAEAAALLFRLPTYWVLVLEAMIVATGIWMFLNWLPLYYQETFNMSLAGAGFSGTFMLQAAAVAGITLGGFLSDRIGSLHLHRRMLFLGLCFLAAAPFLLAFRGKPSYGFISFSIASFSFLRALGASNEHPIVCDLLPSNLRSTAIGIMNTGNSIAGGGGVLFAGYLKSRFGLAEIFGAVTMLILLAAVLVLVGYVLFIRKDLARVQRLETPAASALA